MAKSGMGTALAAVAIVIAIVAVGINFVVPGPTGPRGATGAPGSPATSLWAVVESNGAVLNSSGVNLTTTSWLSGFPGAYQVLFDRNVSGCAYVAGIGGSGVPPAAFVSVAPRFNSNWGVFVQTYNSAGTVTNESFNLAVFC